jgi:L-seryl-tRNA(Ser) seleniumtransferase
MDRTDPERTAALRSLPSVDQLLRDERLQAVSRPLLLAEARRWLDELRAQVADGLGAKTLAERIANGAGIAELLERCRAAQVPRHRRVINATGVVLHTGIGRAPLCQSAIDAVTAACGYAIVEVDPKTGERDQRELGVAALLTGLCGTPGALVVNNNAGATLLMLAALCGGREVVVSRGELVEIGGGFRMPDVMARAGCLMVEVGTTNRTHLRDYEGATSEATGGVLKVHPSNFRLQGFWGVPSLAELVELGKKRSVLVIEDLGSGLLADGEIAGLADEPRVKDSVATDADVVCFSGDKLLGGPQCGILVGKADLIAKIRAHPMYRALRCDKLALAALEATLRVYRDGDPLREIPTLRMLAASAEELQARAQELARLLGKRAAVVPSESFAGSGANPARPLPSFAVALPGEQELCDALRAAGPVPVFARVADHRVLLDMRTLLLEDLASVAEITGRTLRG